MFIKTIILENFRAYKARTIVPVSNLTAFIGKNDAGKSTLLEALDIFFEGGTVKIESADASKGGDSKNVRIGVVFADLPAELILDSKAPTRLANEYLLNGDGDLEIHKAFNCALQAPKATVFAHAVHPTAPDVAQILQKAQKDLKAIIKDKRLENNCNQTENPSMRYAIYQAHADLQLQSRDVPLNEDNGKAIWSSLQNYIPIFALFQSDRPSNDQDPEVQNPMKVAIELALDQLVTELDAITDQVRQKAQETAERTLAKLQATFPNLASTLQPKFKKPPWKNIFKLDLEADDGIPLNKRGSGVRRLILLSFFQAEAEKRRVDAMAGGIPGRRVVYAIEEPETSQHPDSQEQIIRAFRELAEAGDQVLLTTHVPALAGLVPLDSLRYIDREPNTGDVRVRSGSADVYAEIAAALGVLPDPVRTTGLKVAVLVEGKNDIDALRSMASVLAAAGEVEALDDGAIFWTIGGGDHTLMDWIERRYLEKLGIHQIIIQDSDRSAQAVPVSTQKTEWLQKMQGLPNVTAFLTRKRCIDNYIHPDVIARETGGRIVLPAGTDLDYVRMARTIAPLLSAARATGLIFEPVDHEAKPILGMAESPCKRIICAFLMRKMTAAEIEQRAIYQDGGTSRNEVREWIEAIAVRLH
ncbi:ATP-binding protein [Methyloferula stellata]|uniref:ATP-binding protein n=1 Tax=Methyloferula stellata TaxID=876270 RepID=UPI000378B587|nr:ATP-binding protein [Methyloferula stellata]